MKKSFKITFSIALLSLCNLVQAKESINVVNHNAPVIRAGCTPTTATIDLDINNVRARLMDGGDMWWDRGLEVAAYEVPKGSKKNSLFAGSLWVGGKDQSAGNLLKVAAQTYRQKGNDFWSGPLDNTGNVDAQTCAIWDNFWKVDQTQILNFVSIYAGLTTSNTKADTIAIIQPNLSKIADVIKEWPATGNVYAKGAGGVNLNLSNARSYAPFNDVDGDGIYNYLHGDYPKITGDQYIWWVYNDKGNVQTNTDGLSLGLEIQASAFAFATNDCLNDATFYNYKLMNKSTSDYVETYTATWSDADLGYAFDDYVGCDVGRGLGILYNGEDFDPTAGGYGSDIPMIGVDFFQGPLVHDTINGKDTIRPLAMKYFTFFNNVAQSNPQSDPENDAQYYNYMTGKWKDGSPFVQSCTAFGAGTQTNYAFADDYRECSPCNNPMGDRRFVHSAGPFTMLKGSTNDITIGAVWVPSVGGNCPSFGKLRICDDKAQALFDLKFKLPYGPQAPDLVIKPFDNKFVFYISNPFGSNNFNEQYGNADSSQLYREIAPSTTGYSDSLYKFEGYMVFQLVNSTTSLSQIRNSDGSFDETKAKLVFQCDKKNGIKNVFNYDKNPAISVDDFAPLLMATGKDSGIQRSFSLSKDAFASGANNNLVNYKTYYYAVVAYSYNNFSKFNVYSKAGQQFQYLESRTDGRKAPLRVYSVQPTPAYDNIYTDTKVTYGDGISVTRYQGKGNGGNNLELTDATVAEILSSPNNASSLPTYKPNAGPITVKVTNGDSLKPGNYTVYILADSISKQNNIDSAWGAYGPRTKWKIVRDYNGVQDEIYSEQNIKDYNEQVLARYGAAHQAPNPTADWGIAIGMQQKARPGETPDYGSLLINNSIDKDINLGFISGTLTYENSANAWLSGVYDADKNSPSNWIRSGNYVTPSGGSTWHGINMDDYAPPNNSANATDSSNVFGKILFGTWAPYFYANKENSAFSGMGVMYWKGPLDRQNAIIYNNYSVDIVYTNDRTKWTRCSVIEMNEGASTSYSTVNGNILSEKGAFKYNLRNHASLERDPDANGNPVYNSSDSGHSWFPGYAINVETGERLNILFGEDSGDPVNHGNDMIFNPTSTVYDPVNGDLKWGGHHVVYISKTKYDAQSGGADIIYNRLKSMNGTDPTSNSALQVVKRSVYTSMMWVSPNIKLSSRELLSWKDGIIPTKTTVKIRVNRPYSSYNLGNAVVNNGMPVFKFSTADVLPSNLNEAGNQYENNSSALLDRLNVVPNPYYAYSEYEANRLDTKIKIINLPAVATISIYSLDGSLIKVINKSDASTTYVDWDIKNDKNVPVSSGIYLIHIKIKTDQGDKERILKWFAVMRPTDITSF